MSRCKEIASEIGELVDAKCEAYGDSLGSTGAALRLLYPEGIRPEQYDDALLQARIWDKQSRAANRRNAFGEDPFRDMAGYAIRAVEMHEKRERGQEPPCGSANDQDVDDKSKDSSGGSAQPNASRPTTPNASASSEPHPRAAAPTAATPKFVVGDALRSALEAPKRYIRIPRSVMRERNTLRKHCAGCDLALEKFRPVLREAHGEMFWFCNDSCYEAYRDQL